MRDDDREDDTREKHLACSNFAKFITITINTHYAGNGA